LKVNLEQEEAIYSSTLIHKEGPFGTVAAIHCINLCQQPCRRGSVAPQVTLLYHRNELYDLVFAASDASVVARHISKRMGIEV